jgi:hypothetical protein
VNFFIFYLHKLYNKRYWTLGGSSKGRWCLPLNHETLCAIDEREMARNRASERRWEIRCVSVHVHVCAQYQQPNSLDAMPLMTHAWRMDHTHPPGHTKRQANHLLCRAPLLPIVWLTFPSHQIQPCCKRSRFVGTNSVLPCLAFSMTLCVGIFFPFFVFRTTTLLGHFIWLGRKKYSNRNDL